MRKNNKIIVTGLALVSDVKPEICRACNFDFSWIFKYPSTLLWADSIIITPSILESVNNTKWPDDIKTANGYPLAEIKKIFFDKAGEAGLIEIRDPNKHITQSVHEMLTKCVDDDRRAITDMFPKAVMKINKKNVPGHMKIDGMHYCWSSILSIYYGLFLAKCWKAQPLLDDNTYTYLKYSLGIRASKFKETKQELESFTELFHGQLPEIDLSFSTDKKSCWSCDSYNTCDKNEIKEISRRLTEYIKIRDYDEVAQMKTIYSELASKVKGGNNTDYIDEIKHHFHKTQRLINHRLNKLFPMITRWSNLITILSIPIVVAGISSRSAILSGTGAGIAGISQVANKYMEYFTSKNRWLCFRQDCKGNQNKE